MRSELAFALVSFAFLLAHPAFALDEDEALAAEPTVTPPAPSPSATPTFPPLLHGRLELSLDEAIRMALENNLDVEIARYAPVIADYDEDIAWGAFDPELFAEFGYSDRQTPNSNVLFGTLENVNRSTDGFGGFRGILPVLGTEYDARFTGGRATTNNSITALSPEFTSNWSLNLTQPILKDLIWNQPWTQVRTARLVSDVSGEEFRAAIMDTVRGIEDAYWTLVAAAEAQRVARKSLETASALLKQTQTQYDVGVVSKVEVTEAEAGLSRRKVNLILAENDYHNQQDVLIDQVLGPGLRTTSTLEIVPRDRPDEYTEYSVDIEEAVENAFLNRPELASATREVERQKVQLQFAKNQRLPELDGIFSFGESGLSGDQNPDFDPCRFVADNPDTPAIDERAACIANPPNAGQGGFRRNFDDFEDSPTFSARARLSIPFPNTVARKTASKTEIEYRRAKTQKRRVEQNIVIEVRRSARDLKASQQAIVAARAAEAAAAEQLRAERIRLEYGESTPFEVLQREDDLVDRENDLITAFRNWHIAAAALDRAQGTILRNRNVAITEVGRLR